MAGEANDGIFALKRVNEAANWVMWQSVNAPYVQLGPDWCYCLVFRHSRPSKTAGRLATFGRHKDNDIRLPSHGPSGGGREEHLSVTAHGEANEGRRYQNYRNHHCFFFLAASRELILRDLSPKLVHVELENATPEESVLYALHGNTDRGPRQRVIPRTDRAIHITVGTSTHFKLRWFNDLVDPKLEVQPWMATRAKELAVSGMSLTPPAHSASDGSRCLHSRELCSRYTPSVASKTGRVKSCHRYKKLGSGGFGVVYKVVNLSNGELWAVKEIAARRDTGSGVIEKLKASLVHEVETMAKISHEHIVHYETYQEFRVGGSFQIFYRLYQGSLWGLIAADHSCTKLREPAPWMPTMVRQMATALDYLHGKGILHLDIKPENILVDYPGGDESQLPNFYLGDFGLARAEAEVTGRRVGTRFYMAPEIRLSLKKPSKASDI